MCVPLRSIHVVRRHLDDIKKYVPEFVPEFIPEFDQNTDSYSGTHSGMNSGTNFFMSSKLRLKGAIFASLKRGWMPYTFH